jgi:hypothetical protein
MDDSEHEWVCNIRAGNRRIVFSLWEQEYAAQLANGETGWQRYLQLLEIVKAAETPEALKEFQKRFAPMLDQESPQDKNVILFGEPLEKPEKEMKPVCPEDRAEHVVKRGFFARLFGKN